MRITCVIHSLSGGGAERVMAGLASGLATRGHDVHLITLDNGQNDRHSLAASVSRECLNLMQPSNSFFQRLKNTARRVKGLRQAIRRAKPDVVLSFCDTTNVVVLLARRGLDVPVVVSERSDPAQQKLPQPWAILRPHLYAEAQRVVVLTSTAQKHVAPWCRSSPEIIPSAIDLPEDIQELRAQVANREGEPKRLLAVGRLEVEKGFDRLIKAFAAIAPNHESWSLRIVGEGSQRATLQQLIEQHRLTGRVELPGWVRPIWPEYAAADLFVLPSRYEGFPSALLEAMACGLAVVAVDCESGPREIVEHGCNGWLVRNQDQALQTALAELMDNQPLRSQLGLTAQEITSRFSWQRMVDQYEQLLLDVVESAGDKRSAQHNRSLQQVRVAATLSRKMSPYPAAGLRSLAVRPCDDRVCSKTNIESH